MKDSTENELVREITDKLSEEACLEQLIEESSELIQACAKRLRILRGENFTPVSPESNMVNITEELVDVSVYMDVVQKSMYVNEENYHRGRLSKLLRWKSRLNNEQIQ